MDLQSCETKSGTESLGLRLIRVLNCTHWSVCEGPQVSITEAELGVVELGTQVLTALFSLPHGLFVSPISVGILQENVMMLSHWQDLKCHFWL